MYCTHSASTAGRSQDLLQPAEKKGFLGHPLVI
jgi:hypothetical protein